MLKTFLASFLITCFHGFVEAQVEEKESDLKAAFIYNFTRYVEWEPVTESDQFTIGILGPSPIAASLGEIARTNLVKSHRIYIKHFSSPDDIDYCNVLFIAKRAFFPLQSVLNKVNKGVLTISEESGYAKEGTAFNFVIINDKLKFEANLKALNKAGLKASSQLLKLAIIVD